MFGVVYFFKNKGKNGSGHIDLPLSFHQPKESPKKSREPTWARNMKPYFSGLVKQKKKKKKNKSKEKAIDHGDFLCCFDCTNRQWKSNKDEDKQTSKKNT